ncbi:hypothetical protein DBV14_02015 [Variovorax sp. KBW07]|nr:hypothetical protein DBV14_02015 [Variovorax sp. KBW07]
MLPGGVAPPPVNTAGAWLTFNPSPVELTLFPNTPKTFFVTATSSKVISAPVNVAIIDTKGVITSNVKISSAGLQYTATLNTNPALAAGTYTGNFEVRVCFDANPLTCSQPVEGSPWQLPYKFTVIDPATLHYSGWEAAQKSPGFLRDFALSSLGGAPFVVTAGQYTQVMETWTSADIGTFWTLVNTPQAITPLNRGFALASDGSAIYLSGGQDASATPSVGTYLNHVWKFDGTTWTQKTAAAQFPGRANHVMAKVGSTLFVAAGRTAAGDMRNVWRSDDDGVNWTQVSQGLPAELGKPTCALDWKGSLLLVGDQVATSTDGGATFKMASGFPTSFPKGSAQCAVLNGRLFISPSFVEGYTGPAKDAVSTTDLVNWQFERPRTTSMGDAPGMAVVNGRLVVTTGQSTSERTTYRTLP